MTKGCTTRCSPLSFIMPSSMCGRDARISIKHVKMLTTDELSLR